jgi:hypothetical protein
MDLRFVVNGVHVILLETMFSTCYQLTNSLACRLFNTHWYFPVKLEFLFIRYLKY